MALADVVVPKQPASPQPPATPPGSPATPSFPQSVAFDDLKRLVVGLIKEAQKVESTDKVPATASVAEKDVPPAGSRARASRLEYKTVDERYPPPPTHTLQAYVVKLITVQLER